LTKYNLVSLAGLFVLLGAAWLISADRRRMNWRVIGWGVALQLLFALFIFVAPGGAGVFLAINRGVTRLLEPAMAGAKFVFGPLAVGPPDPESLGVIIAFQVFPTVVFFSALMAVLYFLRVMPLVVRGFASVFTRLMRISGAESLCAASNVFVGIESAVTVRPHLAEMTPSELCTVLTAGMATVASSVFGAYVLFLSGTFPHIAGHLISASILSAPAALVMAKIVLPERGCPKTLGVSVAPDYERESNLFEAVINGANAGLRLVGGIMALLIAVLGLVALADLVLGAVGRPVAAAFGRPETVWTLKGLLGGVFYPFALAVGVPAADAWAVAGLLGERTLATEFTAYQSLGALLEQGALADPRSAVVAAYALCGFAHVASLGIFVGGVAALAPSRTRDLSRVALRALAAATLACLLTAAVAGVFLTERSILLGPVAPVR
jgi:CNT family concentrative nucleoside transporter